MTLGLVTRNCFFATVVLSTFGMTHTTNREKDTALGYLLLRATIGTNILADIERRRNILGTYTQPGY